GWLGGPGRPGRAGGAGWGAPRRRRASMAPPWPTAWSTCPPRPGCAPSGLKRKHSTVTRMSTALPDASFAVAVDIGGTFTDIALHDARTGEIWRAKTPSVPSDPSQAFLTGVRLALEEAGRQAPTLGRVLHGTTVATNMILEDKGAKTALVTTEGFRHVLTIGRQDIPRRANYLAWGNPARPLPAARGREVKERIGSGGLVVEPVDEASVHEAAEVCRMLGVEAVAICLLHSFANPAHEQRVAAILRERLPGVAITASCD